MSASNTPFGLVPLVHGGGGIIRPKQGTIASGFATDMFQFSPVKMGTDGNIQAVTGTEAFVGVFMGCEYTDATGIRQLSNRWPANTVTADAICYFTDDPAILYKIQADGSLAQSTMGEVANLSNIGGNTSTGFATCTMSASTATGAARQLRVMQLFADPSNAWGDSFTVAIVQISNHQLVSPVNGF